jgi:hypothetical protein
VPGLTIEWTLAGRGWAECTVSDGTASARLIASYITPAPEDLLGAVTRIVVGEPAAQAEFDAEPAIQNGSFHREGDAVQVRIASDGDGEPWTTRQDVGDLARAVIRAFDHVAWTIGPDADAERWGRPFPHRELEALRTAWRARRDADRR